MTSLSIFFAVVTLIGCAVKASEGKKGDAWMFGIGTLIFAGSSIFTAVEDHGVGYVHTEVQELHTRLEKGVAYEILSETPLGNGDRVILFKREGEPSLLRSRPLRALPVNESTSVPKRFTMIDGQPVAIAAPAAPPLPNAKNAKKDKKKK